MEPDVFDFESLPGTEQINFFEFFETIGFATERISGQFATVAASFTQHGNRNPLRVGLDHSRISKVKRRFSFIPAAPRIVRTERAVRPCFPITLPRSLGATFNSKTVTCSPCTS